MLLTIIIPVYNERNTILQIIKKIKKVKQVKKQIIVVDDGSTDGSREIIKKIKRIDKIIYHKNNTGKGAAINSALKYIKGDLVIIQDADLEYNPKDYLKLIFPFKKKEIKIVFGSRALGRKVTKKKIKFNQQFRIFANFFLTLISNIINNQSLTDAHTCYKVFRKKILLSLKLKEKDFAFCPEVNTKISNLGLKIHEVPISYNPRNIKQGKKIRFKDALKAITAIIKYKFLTRQ